jgi:nitroreductase
LIAGTLAVLTLGAWAVALAQGVGEGKLPDPDKEGGRPLMAVLADRRTQRSYADRPLPPEVLSNLLWAACGVNRPDGKRTAPTAVNWQEIDVYVATAEGLFLYNAQEHSLELILSEDIRALTGRQPFCADAPVNLVYVADYARMGRASVGDKGFYAATDTGFVSQNVYLYCASEGLATVVRGLVDRQALGAKMGLRPDQHITLCQTIGYPG